MDTKTCTKCGETKALDEFHLKPTGKFGRASACKECARQVNAAWAAVNPRKRSEYMAKWYATNRDQRQAKNAEWAKANPESGILRSRRYEQKNKDKRKGPRCSRTTRSDWRQRNADKCAQYSRNWQKKNPVWMKLRDLQKKAHVKRATPLWADYDLIHATYTMAAAMTKLTGVKYHVDHIVPLRSKLVCGLHVGHNMQLLPAKENIVKSNRYWPDMPEQGVRYDRLSSAAN